MSAKRVNTFDGELLHLRDIWSFHDSNSEFCDLTVSRDWAPPFSHAESQVVNVDDQEDPEVKVFTDTSFLNCLRSPVV